MLQTITYFGQANQSGIGALGFDGKTFLIQLVTFILVFLVLRKFAFKPIIKALDDRRTVIEQGVKLGEQMQQKEAQLERQVAETLREAREQADQILADAQAKVRETIQSGEEDAQTKATAILEEARERATQELARARRQLEKEVVGLIADATEAIVQEKLDPVKDAALIERALKGQNA